jgi:hypothetical protein
MANQEEKLAGTPENESSVAPAGACREEKG